MAIDMLSYAIGAKNGGGGGGGGGDCNLFPVTITVDYDNPRPDGNYSFTTDKTFAEIAGAIDAGKMLLIREGTDEYGYQMNVPNNVYHELGSAEIMFIYTSFSASSSSKWGAINLEYILEEDVGNYLIRTEADISVTPQQ